MPHIPWSQLSAEQRRTHNAARLERQRAKARAAGTARYAAPPPMSREEALAIFQQIKADRERREARATA